VLLIRYNKQWRSELVAVPTPGARLALSTTNTYLCGSAGCVTRIVFANRNDGYLFGPDLFTTTDGRADLAPSRRKADRGARHSRPRVVWRLTYANCPGPCGLTLQQQRTGTTSWVTGSRILRWFWQQRGPADRRSRIGSKADRLYEISPMDRLPSVRSFSPQIKVGLWSRKRDPCAPYRSEDASVAAADGTLVVECEWEGQLGTCVRHRVSKWWRDYGPPTRYPQVERVCYRFRQCEHHRGRDSRYRWLRARARSEPFVFFS